MLLAVFGDHRARKRIFKRMKKLADADWSADFAIYEGCSPLDVFMARDHAWPDANPVEFYRGDESSSPENEYWLSYFDPLPYEFKRHARGAVLDAMERREEASLEFINRALRVFKPEDRPRFLPREVIEKVHGMCMRAAAKFFGEFDGECDFIEIAFAFGWGDVVDALDRNERFWQAWDS